MNWNNKKEVLEEVKERRWDLKYASEELQNDKEVVLAAVGNHGGALQYASEELKNEIKDIGIENWIAKQEQLESF